MFKVFVFLVTSVGIFFAIAVGLILSQWPAGAVSSETGLRFPDATGTGSATDVPLQTFLARDGATLGFRQVAGNAADTIVVVHGSGWHGAAYMDLAEGIAQQTGARVLVPDLRGHGPLADPRGDVSYIGQYEDDLADLLDHAGVQAATFVGHSSGGGLVLRLAGGDHGDLVKDAVLMAPFLKYDAPTTRQASGGWAYALTRRLIGLSMLNMVGITALNGLTVLEFNLPEDVLATEDGQYATQSYSYRLNTSFSPRSDFGSDVAALPSFLLLVGEEDEAFFADQYEPTLSAHNALGTYQVLPSLGHLDVLFAPEAVTAIAAYLRD